MAIRFTDMFWGLVRPRAVRWGAILIGAVSFYDAISSQFGLPKLGTLVGGNGTLLPWWGWALVAQALLVVALFEFVRRNFGGSTTVETTNYADPGLAKRVAQIEETLAGSIVTSEIMFGEKVRPHLAPLSKRVDEAEKITKPLAQQRLSEMRAGFVNMVEAERLPKPPARPEGSPPFPPPYAPTGVGPRMKESRRVQMMAELGITGLDTLPEIQKAKDDVLKNAIYCQLEGDDALHWSDGSAKQAWYAHNAGVDAKLRYLSQQGFPPPTRS
jgi:hypothetical protein